MCLCAWGRVPRMCQSRSELGKGNLGNHKDPPKIVSPIFPGKQKPWAGGGGGEQQKPPCCNVTANCGGNRIRGTDFGPMSPTAEAMAGPWRVPSPETQGHCAYLRINLNQNKKHPSCPLSSGTLTHHQWEHKTVQCTRKHAGVFL